MGNVLIPKNKVKGVTTRGGKMTSEATPSKEINEAGINKNEPPRFEQDVQEKPHDVGVKNKSSSIPERTTQPLMKPQQSSIPFPNRISLIILLERLFHQIGPSKKERDFFESQDFLLGRTLCIKLYVNNIMRRCVAGSETLKILAHYHLRPTGGHHSASATEKKVYYWPSIFKDANENGFNFKVNGQQLKKYYEGNINKEDDEVIEFENSVT
ncbi:hypothetical protein Tco_0218169 [Tanacetum coccineum]